MHLNLVYKNKILKFRKHEVILNEIKDKVIQI
jgi:hypothetical protein